MQQRVAETGDALFALLSLGAHFYVCGDANHMAVRARTPPRDGTCNAHSRGAAVTRRRFQGDVDKALRAVLAARLPGGAEDVDFV